MDNNRKENTSEALHNAQERLENKIKQDREAISNARKASDTDDYADKYFHQPVAMIFTKLFVKLGMTPNAVTILSLVFGVAGGILFYSQNKLVNVYGILLQVFAAVLDNSDGQVARITGQSTQLGRVLDGTVDGLNFGSAYIALACRMMKETVPFTDGVLWGGYIWIMILFCGIVSHSSQARMADYFRAEHLFFEKGTEFPKTANIAKEYKAAKDEKNVLNICWLRFYLFYTKLQERATPKLQRLMAAIEKSGEPVPAEACGDFIKQSRKYIQLTNVLTFSLRAYLLYLMLLTDTYVWYFPFVIIVLGATKYFMNSRYERISESICNAYYPAE